MWAKGLHRHLHLGQVGRAAVSFFNIASAPFNHRDEACDLLLNSALVVSVPAGSKAFVYSGVNSLLSIGHRARGVFTPPGAKVNVPASATYAIGSWGLWAEVDIGPLHAVGIGLTRLF